MQTELQLKFMKTKTNNPTITPTQKQNRLVFLIQQLIDKEPA